MAKRTITIVGTNLAAQLVEVDPLECSNPIGVLLARHVKQVEIGVADGQIIVKRPFSELHLHRADLVHLLEMYPEKLTNSKQDLALAESMIDDVIRWGQTHRETLNALRKDGIEGLWTGPRFDSFAWPIPANIAFDEFNGTLLALYFDLVGLTIERSGCEVCAVGDFKIEVKAV